MKVTRIQAKTKKDSKKEWKDRKQYNRLFNRKFRGGLPKSIKDKYNELYGGKNA